MSWNCFFFNDPATPEIYPLSLHDALPISLPVKGPAATTTLVPPPPWYSGARWKARNEGTEEHTSELQSQRDFVCRLLL